MDAAELRARQAPLKEQYRTDPAGAATPLGASATFADPGITATVGSWAGPVRAGLHPATGGDGSDACSGDMLLEAVLACAGVTLRSVATVMGVEIRSAALSATGSFDARGTLGLDREVPVGVGPVTIEAVLDTDADDAALHRLAVLTERYCVVGQSLRVPPALVVRRVAEGPA
ncbi:OsmC family protein [Antribacter gilvus]|uniref:OsmC family protein n=1 Tax=Antribacter gilvus TaxID=2304675 RepID=UPI000F795730|nr:OsmC family protein [Antribacter gilvus]